MARCADVTECVLHEVFHALHRHAVTLEHMLLKPSMVLPGKEAAPAAPAEVAAQTVQVLRRTVPAAVPGIFFLSGGQTPTEATANLDAMNRLGPMPWRLSFSYGRALQEPPLLARHGEAANAARAQEALLQRARLNGMAARGSTGGTGGWSGLSVRRTRPYGRRPGHPSGRRVPRPLADGSPSPAASDWQPSCGAREHWPGIQPERTSDLRADHESRP